MKPHKPLVAVLEDSKTDFFLIDHILSKAGYHVVDANALWDLPERTIAVVTDWMMPPWMEVSR